MGVWRRSQFEQPSCLRASYGLTDTRNMGHGSDSQGTAIREINFFFPDINENQWSKEIALMVSNGIVFDETNYVHVIKNEPSA